jgi:hypothetical protein
MLDRATLQRLLPKVQFGPEVSGASYGHIDGHVNPLRLLAALQRGLQLRGGHLRANSAVSRIAPRTGGGFEVQVGAQRFEAAQVIVAAGLGSLALGRMVGLDVPLRAQRGQLLVTERLAPILPLPASGLRQTAEGTVMVGVTQEEVGFDLSTTTAAAARMSRHAARVLPALGQALLVRHWSCLRIMTPDGCPVYAGSVDQPGAWIALCHSGITLAAFHAGAACGRIRASAHSGRTAGFSPWTLRCFANCMTPGRQPPALTLTIDGQNGERRTGATALLRSCCGWTRRSRAPPPVSGSPRTPYCMMGVCFECLASVDGVASTQTCLVQVREGMRVERQHGRRALVMAVPEDTAVSDVGDVDHRDGMPGGVAP